MVSSIDEYIQACPAAQRALMGAVREALHEAVPGAGESISYQMPTITLNGKAVVHFAAWKKHLGMYPVPGEDQELLAELVPYAGGTGTLRFPWSKPLPLDLMQRVAAVLAARHA